MGNDEVIDELYDGPKREPDIIRRTRILYVKDYLEKYTDENRSASMYEIIKYLNKNGITAERKSIRDDIIALKEYGMDIELENGKQWKLMSRDFDFVEIKMIIDCVAASKFLSEKKSKQLIEKIESLASSSHQALLYRQNNVTNQTKSSSDLTLYFLDTIIEALDTYCDLEFNYCYYNAEKKMENEPDGIIHHVNPRKLIYENNTYYLLVHEGKKPRLYRVDRMNNVRIAEQIDNYIPNGNEKDDTAFSEVSGIYPSSEVTMQFTMKMMEAVIDRFGDSVKTIKIDDEHFRVKTMVEVSPQFYGWIFSLGENVMIEYPLSVAKTMKDMLKERHKAYRESHSSSLYLT